jgi:hypothetical protein
MRRTLTFGLLGATIIAGLTVTSARLGAITYGFADTYGNFGNVGAFIVKAPTTGNIYPICSGTLIAPDVFLTASHCTAYFEASLAPRGYAAFVSFDSPIPFDDLSVPATTLVPVASVVTNPYYNQAQSDPGDIAVLLVSPTDTSGITPAMLPTAGQLDVLSAQNGLKNSVYAVVGYGLQNRVVGGGVPYFQDINPIPRMYAFSTFNAINKAWLRLSQNPATGDGGACFGDSGGPNFLMIDGVRTLVAITITGDAVCRATNVVYRLDTPSARAFLAPYVELP